MLLIYVHFYGNRYVVVLSACKNSFVHSRTTLGLILVVMYSFCLFLTVSNFALFNTNFSGKTVAVRFWICYCYSETLSADHYCIFLQCGLTLLLTTGSSHCLFVCLLFGSWKVTTAIIKVVTITLVTMRQ